MGNQVLEMGHDQMGGHLDMEQLRQMGYDPATLQARPHGPLLSIPTCGVVPTKEVGVSSKQNFQGCVCALLSIRLCTLYIVVEVFCSHIVCPARRIRGGT